MIKHVQMSPDFSFSSTSRERAWKLTHPPRFGVGLSEITPEAPEMKGLKGTASWQDQPPEYTIGEKWDLGNRKHRKV